MADPRGVDVAIVGGGPAGLATAIAVRRAGLSVTVLDRRRPPLDKACGEGLMPDALACLGELGVRPMPRFPFHGIRYLDGRRIAEGRFPGLPGAGVRRTVLHSALLTRAVEVGADVRWQSRVERIETSAEGAVVITDAGELRARYAVGADGLRSPIRAAAGLASGRAETPLRRRFGVRRHYALTPWSDLVEVHWGDCCEAYVTPVADDEVGVAMLWSGRKARFDELLEGFPALADRLRGAAPTSRDRGAGPFDQRVHGVVRDRLALVGDAAGYLDAITGEGLALAFHGARALAAALADDDLDAYARQHRRLVKLPDRLTRLTLWLERRPALRRKVIAALAREPTIFSRILAVHCRALPARRLAWPAAPRLLWRLVRP